MLLAKMTFIWDCSVRGIMDLYVIFLGCDICIEKHISVDHYSYVHLPIYCLSLSVQYKTCKDGSVLGVTVMRIAMLTHCQALTQSCSYTEGNTHIYTFEVPSTTDGCQECRILFLIFLRQWNCRIVQQLCVVSHSLSVSRCPAETIVNVLDFKKDVGLWHAVLTVSKTLFNISLSCFIVSNNEWENESKLNWHT